MFKYWDFPNVFGTKDKKRRVSFRNSSNSAWTFYHFPVHVLYETHLIIQGKMLLSFFWKKHSNYRTKANAQSILNTEDVSVLLQLKFHQNWAKQSPILTCHLWKTKCCRSEFPDNIILQSIVLPVAKCNSIELHLRPWFAQKDVYVLCFVSQYTPSNYHVVEHSTTNLISLDSTWSKLSSFPWQCHDKPAFLTDKYWNIYRTFHW